jgi:hypothetical protein
MGFSTPTANHCNSKQHQQSDTTSIHGVQHTNSQPLQQQTASTDRYNINTWGSAQPQPTAATANSIISPKQQQYMGFSTRTANRCNSKQHQQTDTTSIHGVQHTHSQPLQQQTASTDRYNINTWGSAHPQPTAATANSINSQR